jgi:cyclopropane-fatty-acyl-phospholipid synthase
MPGFEIFGDEERKEVHDVLETGIFHRYGFDGPRKGHWKAKSFEEAFCEKTGAKHSLLVSSGTAALSTALAATGVGAGDEVISPSMTYSAALFRDGAENLVDAQRTKLRTIIEKAGITAEDHVLEIGCGWGSFAIEAVRQTGCRLTGITLSHEQLRLARQRVKEAGLEERIDLKICDYRQIEGRYSKIVSIEMLEAVGHAGLKEFFAACDRVLLPGGTAVIQVITIPDRKYNAYRFSSDWIRKHIFPGGHLPSIGALARAMAADSRLNIASLQNYGLDYGRTLELWRQTLQHQRRQVMEFGYDEDFLRKWDYYFAYCQAGFAARIIDLAQLVVEKPPE